MSKKEGVSALKMAGAYIGTIVGAGFATGQEVLQFFSRFGATGIAGLIVTTVMFIIFGYIIMDLGGKLSARSHVQIIKYSCGKILGTIIDLIITFFLFGALSAMIAGTGALFAQQFNLPGFIGNIIMAALTAITVLSGIRGVINSISFVVPFLLAAVIIVSIFAIISSPPDIYAMPQSAQKGLISNWLFSSVLYVSYNTIISVAVLAPLGAQAENKKAVKYGALLGGLGLGIGSVMIYLALASNMAEISRLEVPMIYIAGKIGYIAQTVYAIVLIAEIYTTAVGSLYGFVARFADISKNKTKTTIIVFVSTFAALLASRFGFSNLVKYLYPIVGYGGVVLLACLLYVKIKKKKSVR